jgi:hypothetical protein
VSAWQPPARIRWAAAIGCGVALAAAGSAAPRRWLPLAPDDPFRSTLVLLPWILVALSLVQHWTARRGGWRLSAAGTAAELAALGLCVLLVLARPLLGLSGSEQPIAAGFLLVLAHRLARQLRAARPLLGRRLTGVPDAVFFVLPFAAYLAILPWSAEHRQPDGDEPYYLLLTHSLAYDGDADLTNNYARGDWRHFMARPIGPQPGDPVGPHGELYSRHNALLPLLLVPAYRLAGKLGALATMAAMAAALAWMTLRLARHYVPDHPGEALVAYALVAFASPLPLYSYQVWVEVPAALLAMLALDAILDLAPDTRAGAQTSAGARGGSTRWLVILGAALLLPLVKIRFMLISGPLLALAWWRAGRRRRSLAILALLVLALGAAILLLNLHLYGNALKVHSWEEIDPSNYSPLAYLTGLLGIFYDAAFGLFGSTPIWLLLLPAALLLLWRGHQLPVHLGFLMFPYLVIVAPRGEWYGGWSPPFRYALLALPLLGIALVPLLAERRQAGARALMGALGALTLVLLLVWITVPGWTYNFADGRTFLLDGLGARLGAAVARFFPSSVRPRAATWIWPPASLLMVTLAWWWPNRGPWKSWGERWRAWHAADRSAAEGTGRRRRQGANGAPRAAFGGGAGGAGIAGLAGLAGIAALLAAAALLPVAAARWPTHVIELEDREVVKSGGHPYPDRWVIERTSYRGSWVLRVGERLTAPVVPGGRRVRLRLSTEFIRNQPVPFTLDFLAGGRLLASWTPARERVWECVTVGPVDWPAGAPLVLAAHGPSPPGQLNGALLDRVDLDWR